MNICVFSGCSGSVKVEYRRAADELGKEIARRKHNLIYGGSRLGLMGIVSKSARDAGAHVTGIVPKIFEHLTGGETELIVVPDFSKRLQEMDARSDAFITLPGGIGSLYEIMDVLHGRQLNFHSKPLVLINTLGFYNPLITQLEMCVKEGFMPKDNIKMWYKAKNPCEALNYIERYSSSAMSDKIEFAKGK